MLWQLNGYKCVRINIGSTTHNLSYGTSFFKGISTCTESTLTPSKIPVHRVKVQNQLESRDTSKVNTTRLQNHAERRDFRKVNRTLLHVVLHISGTMALCCSSFLLTAHCYPYIYNCSYININMYLSRRAELACYF